MESKFQVKLEVYKFKKKGTRIERGVAHGQI